MNNLFSMGAGRGGFWRRWALLGLLALGTLAARGQGVGYDVPATGRFVFINESGSVIKVDTLTGDFFMLDPNAGVWNAVDLPIRDARDADENAHNIAFLAAQLTEVNVRRLSDAAHAGARFRFISLYYNPDLTPMAPPSDPSAAADAPGSDTPTRLLRYDSVTGEFALLDGVDHKFVRVAIPTKPANPAANTTNARLVGSLKM